jgi:soluble lytic murein transglycosylase
MSGREPTRLGRLAIAACWAGWCALSCERRAAPQPPVASTAAPAEPVASAAPEGGPPSGGAPWPALVAATAWDGAWQALEVLPAVEKDKPEIRYVRARVALARKDAAAALPLLDGLESTLPLLARDVQRRRAEAQIVVGPFAEGAEWFAARPTPASQLDAARAFEKARDYRRARVAADRVVAADKRTRDEEAEARALRSRLPEPAEASVEMSDEQRADARWLATLGADLPAASEGLTLLARVDPRHPLTADEWMLRSRVLSDGGRLEESIRAVELSALAPGADKIHAVERERARGMALYRARGHWTEASKVLAECASVGGQHAAEDAFYAARALSRADRDEEAMRGYEDVQRRFPKSPFATQAAFLDPYLRMLHGEWHECDRGFAGYLRDHPTGDDARDARRDGALCRMLDGGAKTARAAFEQLVEDEPDPIVSARMADMAALAALRDGDRTHAVTRWTDVARSRPLSWPALVARARLAAIGAPVPPSIDPAEDAATTEPPPLAPALPAPADTLHALGLELDAEVALRERESTVTMGTGPRAPEALCRAYGELGRARRRFQIAQTLPSALFAAAPSSRTRWAWECEYPAPYDADVRRAEVAEKLPEGILWAVMRQESAFDPDAVSPAGALGLMQLLPETAHAVAEEMDLPAADARPTNPRYAIRVAARLLHKLLEQFRGDVPLAVAAYNGGAESVERWSARAPGLQLDTFVERIPFRETREYVARVMGNLARYAYLAKGEDGVPRVELELRR